MKPVDKLQDKGLALGLRAQGRPVTASTGERLDVLILPIPMLPQPEDLARAKTPVFVRVVAERGSVGSPRAVTSFVTEDAITLKVLRYEQLETYRGQCWICEMGRR